jgi:hypothetical protein
VTNFFITFELNDGRRMNFSVDAGQFNLIIENDTGTLTYKEQGNLLLFIDFRRN